MQYITAIKCITTHTKIREIVGALGKNVYVLYFHPSPSKFGHSLPMKFMFLEWARLGQPTAEKKLTSLPWIEDFMMNLRKSVTKSGKRTSCFDGLSWQQRKQYKSNVNKNFLRDLQMHMYPLSKLYLNWSCHSGVWRGVHSALLSLGQGVGQKNVGRTKFKWTVLKNACMFWFLLLWYF